MEKVNPAEMNSIEFENHLDRYVTKGNFSMIEKVAPQIRRSARREAGKARGSSPFGDKMLKAYMELSRDDFTKFVVENC